MAESYADEEARIIKACDALERFEKPNISRAARDFHVNERKLRNRFNGIPSKSEYGGHNKTLTDDQELAVCHYLDRIDKTGIFARPRMLRSIANSILARNHNDLNTPPPLIGPNWPRRFLARHPEYIKQKIKPLAHNKKNIYNFIDICIYFEKF
jgi:Tc5 transposase DNA-binding domain